MSRRLPSLPHPLLLPLPPPTRAARRLPPIRMESRSSSPSSHRDAHQATRPQPSLPSLIPPSPPPLLQLLPLPPVPPLLLLLSLLLTPPPLLSPLRSGLRLLLLCFRTG